MLQKVVCKKIPRKFPGTTTFDLETMRGKGAGAFFIAALLTQRLMTYSEG
jgi:hypothetical protein